MLTGVHLGDYHPDPATDLGDLLAALLRETGIPRIRVSSLEPEDFKLEWLELWRNPRLCRHLHLPAQSGSDAILRRMARRYDTTRYLAIARAAREVMPGMALTTDMIVGFPGETEDDFTRSLELAREAEFAKIHVFRFSPRAGTAAARMPARVKDPVKRERSERLIAQQDELAATFRRRHIGQVVEVLWEQGHPWGWEGLTDNYLRVEIRDDAVPDGRDPHNQCGLVLVQGMTADAVYGNLMERTTELAL